MEQDVRFVHLFDWGWDFHGTGPGEVLTERITNKWAKTYQPMDFNHERWAFGFQSRSYRLTDVQGAIVREIRA